MVMAAGGVVAEYVAVAMLQFLVEGGFVDCTGATVVGECAKENAVFAVTAVEGAKLFEVFAQKCVGLCLRQLASPSIGFAGQHSMTEAHIRAQAEKSVHDIYVGNVKFAV